MVPEAPDYACILEKEKGHTPHTRLDSFRESLSRSPMSHIYFFFCLFAFSRAAPAAYGDSQARGPIGAVATGLRQSHSNAGSEPRLQPTPQLTATQDP